MSETLNKQRRGFHCPNCGGKHLLVVYTRPVGYQRIKRRRECVQCEHRMTSYEHIAAVAAQGN